MRRQSCPHKPHRKRASNASLPPVCPRVHVGGHLPGSVLLTSNYMLATANFPGLKFVAAGLTSSTLYFYSNNRLNGYKVGGTACADIRRACTGTCKFDTGYSNYNSC